VKREAKSTYLYVRIIFMCVLSLLKYGTCNQIVGL